METVRHRGVDRSWFESSLSRYAVACLVQFKKKWVMFNEEERSKEFS